jgi:hypothetical protein
MKTIYTSTGADILVDDTDYEFLNQWKWKTVGAGYAGRHTRGGMVYMHRLLALGKGNIKGGDVDHINGNKLDNRKDNLRVVTKSENQRGFRKSGKGGTGYRGVHLFRNGKYVARLKCGDKYLNLGYFATIEDAIEARRQAEIKYWGKSNLN